MALALEPEPLALEPAPAPLVDLALWPEPLRRRPPGAIQWTLLGVGLVGVAAGATLFALDGRPGCELMAPQLRCPMVLDTRAPGITLVSLGAAAGVAGVVLLGIELSQKRRQRP